MIARDNTGPTKIIYIVHDWWHGVIQLRQQVTCQRIIYDNTIAFTGFFTFVPYLYTLYTASHTEFYSNNDN